MRGELLATNIILQHTWFLANFVISNGLVEKVKMTKVDDKEQNAFMDKSTNIKVDDVQIVRFRWWLCVPNDERLTKPYWRRHIILNFPYILK